MNFAIARILLFIIAGALLNSGWVSEEVANFIRLDPDLQQVVGAAIAGIAFTWWRIAKAKGWRT